MITMISAIDMANGIGDEDGNLLYDIPEDLKHFKQETFGGVVIMGRKTWDSLKKKPLVGRKNYVLTNDKDFKPDGAKVLNSIDEILKLSKSYRIHIIGGGNLYQQMLPYADELVLTHIHAVDMKAVSFFPDYSHEDWKLIEKQKYESYNGDTPAYTIARYKNTNK